MADAHDKQITSGNVPPQLTQYSCHFHLQILSAFLLTEFTIFDMEVSVLNIKVDCN
ncbi:hypothetical protein IKN40_03615 [bacterium]|nr:hypothetical protein [bacterium]